MVIDRGDMEGGQRMQRGGNGSWENSASDIVCMPECVV